MIRLGKNEVLKTSTFVDTNAKAGTEGITIALSERQFRRVKKKKKSKFHWLKFQCFFFFGFSFGTEKTSV